MNKKKNLLIVIIVISLVFIFLVGFFIFNSHPSVQPKPTENRNSSLISDYITSFGLTLSNPLVLLVLGI